MIKKEERLIQKFVNELYDLSYTYTDDEHNEIENIRVVEWDEIEALEKRMIEGDL